MTIASDMYAHCCASFRAFLLSLTLTIPITSIASAHVGVTVPFVEVPDPAAITIDGDDGDWAFFDPRLALDREGFFDRESDQVDAADFDFTIYTAWSPPPDNSWYCFARISDDTLKIENEDPLKWWRDDTLSITVDSDHSGGSIYGFTREELVNGQRYYARVLPLQHPRLPHGQAGFLDQHHDPFLEEFLWAMDKPHFDIAWTMRPLDAANGALHVEYTFEWKAALWDVLGSSPEKSKRHVFVLGQTLHLGFRLLDADRPGSGRKHSMYILGGHQHQDRNADRMPDFRTITLDEAKNWRMPVEQDAELPPSADGK